MTINVCYIWDEKLIDQCNRLPAVPDRVSDNYNLFFLFQSNISRDLGQWLNYSSVPG